MKSLRNKFKRAIARGIIASLLLASPVYSGSLFLNQITGGDEAFIADVVNNAGRKELLVSATVTVKSLLGKYPNGSAHAFFGANMEDANGIGAAGDTVTITIPAGPIPLVTFYPSVSVVTTVQTSDVSDNLPERAVATRVCNDLNADSDFIAAQWKCQVFKDHGAIFISNKLFNDWGTRTSWTMVCSGTTTCSPADFDLIRRGLETELTVSPNDFRLGVLGIVGTVTQVPGGVGDIFINFLVDGSTSDMRIDGSSTAVDYTDGCDSTKDKLVNEIRIYAGCNGMKFAQFLCDNMALTVGISVTIRSDGKELTLPIIKTTEDFKNKFAFGSAGPGGNFRIDVQPGADQMLSSLLFAQPAIIKKCGTNGTGTDDFVRVRISDDLTTVGLAEFESLDVGFLREP